jgi:protein required for attachment to host cells
MWVLVAENSHARVYSFDRQTTTLQLIREFSYPRGRIKPVEFYTDRPGRSIDSAHPGRHSLSSRVEPRDQEVTKFARELVRYLYKELSLNSFHRLVLITPPQFLGALRTQMPPSLRKAISHEIIKDFASWVSDAEMRERLPELIQEPVAPI